MNKSFVTATCIGRRGEFGNQLFQIAAVLGHAHRHGREAVFNKWFCRHLEGRDYATYFPDLNYRPEVKPRNRYDEAVFTYAEIPDKPGLDLNGNFQSEKYFLPVVDEIRKTFREPRAITPLVESFLRAQGISSFSALQMRYNNRDVVDANADMYNLPEHYFVEAAKRLPTDRKLLLVTNSATRASIFGQKHLGDRDYLVVSHRNLLIDFYLLTRASFVAISNSTFGWWGAYLNPLADKVHAPIRRRWFGFPARLEPKWNTKDLYPDRFVEVPF